MKINIYNEDCLKQLPKIKDKIDLVVVDLPYGQTACGWDSEIDLKQMWIELKKICKRECIYVFFCTTKFGYKLIQSNEKWYRYDLVWEKSRKVGFLSANKMPLRKHEMIYVFSDDNTDDLDNSRNLGLRNYFKNIQEYTKTSKKDILKDIGQSIDHCLRFNSSQFGLPTEKTYNILIEKYKLREMPGFREYKSLTDEWEKLETTYNPQKTEGKPYTTGLIGNKNNVYNIERNDRKENKGDRHPSSILQFEPEHEMIYVFSDENNEDTENNRNLGLRRYAEQVKNYINKPTKDIKELLGHVGIQRFYSKGTIFRLPTEKTYNILIEKYKLRDMPGFREYKSLTDEWEKLETTYNPQKTEGKPYKTNGGDNESYYRKEGTTYNFKGKENKGDRHPSTILKFNNPKKSLHRTQKPTDLLEWIIKSYSNEGETVLDFTMGSGSTGIACLNTNRNFIGIEKDKEIFKIAQRRLLKYEIEEMAFN